MRFNDTGYLEAWKNSGGKEYPKIHDDIFKLIKEGISAFRPNECRFLDLCCSTGLLGQRLKCDGYIGWGVDAQMSAIQAAHDFGIDLSIECARIGPRTLDNLIEVISQREIKVLIARRCFPELFGDALHFGRLFARKIHEAGIRHIFIEGRIKTARATNALNTVEKEAELMIPYFEVKDTYRNTAHLVAT